MPDETWSTLQPSSPEQPIIERERLAALISEVGTALIQKLAMPEMLNACCEAMVHNLDAALARVWMLNSQERLLELVASAGLKTDLDGPYRRVPVGQLKIGRIAQEREPILLNDLKGDARLNDSEWAQRHGIVAFAGYPLIVDDQVLGVVALFSRAPLSQAAWQALATVAKGIALGIERKLADTQLKEQTEVVETINRIGQMLSGQLDQQNLVQAVTDAATELTGAHFGSFFYNVINEQGASYMLYTLSGVPREAFSHFPMPRATDLFGPTFRGEGTILIEDVKKDARYGKCSPYYGMPEGHLPVTSYLAVPVMSRSGEVIGGLFFGHERAAVFTERAARIVEGLAAQTAIAMDNARLYLNAQEALRNQEMLLAREQEAREEAENANRAKDEFLGMLSHELRTPLNAILGWTSMLRSGHLGQDRFDRALETIDRNARSQARLIEDMLDVSRIISGKLRLDIQPVDLAMVINAAADTARPAAEARNIRLQIILDYGAGLVLGDPVRLQQVIWNLLSNAIKFTPKDGRVQVQLLRVNSHLEVSVIDTGRGIDEEFLPYVFDRFRQAEGVTTRKHGGLGLGLAIVRHLVELHGGSVEASNRRNEPGEHGAIFTVKLPVMIVRASSPPHVPEPERVHPTVSRAVSFDCPPSLEGVRVLVVDDEVDARELVGAILQQCQADVRTCGSAVEALAAIGETVPDVLVSDIGMPGENGYSLIEKVRALQPQHGGRIPAVALTAYARVEDRLRALSAGYNMHVPKPVEPAELAIVIASLIERNRKA